MGASKALAEWAVEAASAPLSRARDFATVRFGNVLGSSGSVVPIFRRQIAAGGPVTVTDEAMTRYFMTIPEAVQLIIRAGALEGGGQVYVLEMGDPVKIVDLARNMIRLSGREPDDGHRDRDRRPPARREDPRGAVQPRRAARSRRRPRRSWWPSATPLDPDWVDETFSHGRGPGLLGRRRRAGLDDRPAGARALRRARPRPSERPF